MAIGVSQFIDFFPIGGIIPWVSPTAGSPQPSPPDRWEYADGGMVTTPTSPLFGTVKPPLMTTVETPGTSPRFIKGADTTVAYGGAIPLVTGGSATHGHTATATGSHSHSGNTASAGSHSHSSATGSTSPGTSIESSNFGPAGFAAGAQTVALSHTHTVDSHSHSISSDGSHTHSFNTNSDGSHTHTIDIVGNEPEHVELAWIIRVI